MSSRPEMKGRDKLFWVERGKRKQQQETISAVELSRQFSATSHSRGETVVQLV